MLGHVHDRIHGNLRVGLDQAGKRRELSDGSPGPRTGARPTAPRQGGLKYGVFKRERPRQQALVLTDCEPCGLRGPSRRSMRWWQSSDVRRLKSPWGWAGPTQGSRGGAGRAGASPGATSSAFRGCRGRSHRPLPDIRSPACCSTGGEPAGNACMGCPA